MLYGAISNSWREQLASKRLIELVEEAQRRGARHVELRQTCLGECETGQGDDWRPVMAQLKAIVDRFPSLTFDLAMAWPCLSRPADPMGAQFQAALAAAKLVGRTNPHLRVVDSAKFDAAWEKPQDIPAVAMGVADLAREAARQGVIFSMENSGQPIRSMAMLVKEARSRLASSARPYLGLCPDPTNQLRSFPQSNPLAELDAVPLDIIKLVHFKQARAGKPHPTVDTGDLDCIKMQEILETKGYRGVAIMEIPPHSDVFNNLTASFRFLGAAAAGD
ncbi:MAG: hypothetical protein FJ316_11375 [SAR202 cluster bacterium]|nr:hypothetical protein [SAR202 cluster bacterium]